MRALTRKIIPFQDGLIVRNESYPSHELTGLCLNKSRETPL